MWKETVSTDRVSREICEILDSRIKCSYEHSSNEININQINFSIFGIFWIFQFNRSLQKISIFLLFWKNFFWDFKAYENDCVSVLENTFLHDLLTKLYSWYPYVGNFGPSLMVQSDIELAFHPLLVRVLLFF